MSASQSMQKVRLKAPSKGAQAELIKLAAEAANDLLETTERVLVVYGKGGASIYYDASERTPRTVA